MARKKKRFVVIATASRPWIVAMGELVEQTEHTATLKDARCAIYFSRPTKGLFGLAERGPQEGSRVTGAVMSVTLRYETILDCTPGAIKAWKAEPWS